MSKRSRATGLAPVMTLPGAAFLVHQLRFMLAFGGGANIELQRTGHSYLHSVVPWIVLLIALAVGLFLRAVGRALAGQTSVRRYTLSLTGFWAVCSAALMAIYVSQELLEGLFALGHPGGLAGIFAYGGWWSIPSAIGVGLVLATLFHGARWMIAEVAKRHALRLGDIPRPGPALALPQDLLRPPLAPLAGGWSGRGPPS